VKNNTINLEKIEKIKEKVRERLKWKKKIRKRAYRKKTNSRSRNL